jgi:hypothetical protein
MASANLAEFHRATERNDAFIQILDDAGVLDDSD